MPTEVLQLLAAVGFLIIGTRLLLESRADDDDSSEETGS